MKKQKIPEEKRYAVYMAHNKRCAYCEEPIKYDDLWIEHIVPEHLLSKVDEKNKVLKEYGLEEDFNINGEENFVPTHASCNRKKGAKVVSKRFASFNLELAKSKLEKVKSEEKKYLNNLRGGVLKSLIESSVKKGFITKDELYETLDNLKYFNLIFNEYYEQVEVIFGLTVEDVMNSNLLPSNISFNYASLCDWLEEDLIQSLTSILSTTFYSPEPSERNGETLSVKLVFTALNLNELKEFQNPWWKILEIGYFDISEEWFKPFQ